MHEMINLSHQTPPIRINSLQPWNVKSGGQFLNLDDECCLVIVSGVFLGFGEAGLVACTVFAFVLSCTLLRGGDLFFFMMCFCLEYPSYSVYPN